MIPHHLSPHVLNLLLNDSEALTSALRTMEQSLEVKIDHYQKAIRTVSQPKPDVDALFPVWIKKNSGCDSEERKLIYDNIIEIITTGGSSRKELMVALNAWNTKEGYDPSSPYEVYYIPADPVNSFIHYYSSLQYPLGTLVDETTVEEAQIQLENNQSQLWLIQKEITLTDSIYPSLFYQDDSDQPSEDRIQAYNLICQTIAESHSKEDLQLRITKLKDPEEQTAILKTVIDYLEQSDLVSDQVQPHRSGGDSDEDEEDSDEEETYSESGLE
jgi:hypothetical protein